jgi:HEPN domain-containing protein
MKEHEEWLARAKSCLALAGLSANGDIRAEDLCFQAQQAAEKALKALLIKSGVSIPRTHDLVFLVQDVAQYYRIPENIKNIVELNDYAVQT